MNLTDTNIDVRVVFKDKEIIKEALSISMKERAITDTENGSFIINGNKAIRIYYDNMDLNLLNINE